VAQQGGRRLSKKNGSSTNFAAWDPSASGSASANDWADASRTEVVPKRSGVRDAAASWQQHVDEDETSEDMSVRWPEPDDPTVRMPPEPAEALIGRPGSWNEENPTVTEGSAREVRTPQKNRPRAVPLPEDWERSEAAADWLPPAPRLPSEFAHTQPPTPRTRSKSRGKNWRAVRYLLSSALLMGTSFTFARVAPDAELRGRVLVAAESYRQGARAFVASILQEPARGPEPGKLAATGANATVPAAPQARPAHLAESSAPRPPPLDAPHAPIPVVRVEDLPLLAESCEGRACDKAAKAKARTRRVAPSKR
jgi:hypothetical protein